MQLDGHGLMTVAALLILLGLLLPKRRWQGIRARFRLVATGERHHPYGPPDRQGDLSQDAVVRALQLVAAELRRAFELGIPLHLLGTWLESRGALRRAADEEERRESWSGLLMRHLRGEMAEEEFIGRLRERNLPLPAPKLVWT